MIEKFIKWYKLTHWMYEKRWLDISDGRFNHPETQLLFIAYRAGYNKHKNETKN